MAQTGRSNVRYVDPQRRYTVVLSPSWNAPFGALPHDDRAGTHDSADGQCGSYASVGRGQAATKIFRRYPQRGVAPWESGTSAAAISPLYVRFSNRLRQSNAVSHWITPNLKILASPTTMMSSVMMIQQRNSS